MSAGKIRERVTDRDLKNYRLIGNSKVAHSGKALDACILRRSGETNTLGVGPPVEDRHTAGSEAATAFEARTAKRGSENEARKASPGKQGHSTAWKKNNPESSNDNSGLKLSEADGTRTRNHRIDSPVL